MSAVDTVTCDVNILDDPVAEARRIAAAIDDAHVAMRLLGGVAIRLHADLIPKGLERGFADLDYVVPARAGHAVSEALASLGYTPNERFNMLNGRRRMVFYDSVHHRHVDVFVGEFRMCHELDLTARLTFDAPTLPLADLLLTKLQVHEVNHKDVQDLALLLLGHEVADHDDDAVNGAYLSRVLAQDWGLWRTATGTLQTLVERLDRLELAPQEQQAIGERAAALRARVDAEPKSLRWRSRAKLGERRCWYEQPEEIGHAEH